MSKAQYTKNEQVRDKVYNTFTKEEQLDHDLKCPNRIVTCKKCFVDVTASILETHNCREEVVRNLKKQKEDLLLLQQLNGSGNDLKCA
jgi:hypothetical protein